MQFSFFILNYCPCIPDPVCTLEFLFYCSRDEYSSTKLYKVKITTSPALSNMSCQTEIQRYFFGNMTALLDVPLSDTLRYIVNIVWKFTPFLWVFLTAPLCLFYCAVPFLLHTLYKRTRQALYISPWP